MNIDILLLHVDFSTIHCLYVPGHLYWDTMVVLAWIILLSTHTHYPMGFSY